MERKIELRKRAIQLRREGKTYSEINNILNKKISKGTMSCWCSKIKLSKSKEKRIEKIRLTNLEKARIKAIATNKNKQERLISDLSKKNIHLIPLANNKDIKKLILSVLYLGEGAKWKSHRGLQLGNSNMEVVEMYLNLLEACYDVDRKKLKASIYRRYDQKAESLVSLWSKKLKIPKENFYITKPDLRTKGKETRIGYYGVCSIFGPNTKIQLELEEIAKLLLKNFGPIV